MVKHRLVNLETRHNLSDKSFAYRKGRSASMCLNEIGHKISSLRIEKYKVVMLALDINKAYDCVNLALLEEMLVNKSVPSEITVWILNFFSKRTLALGQSAVEVYGG